MTIDFNSIINEVLQFECSPTAREAAAPLIESWIERYSAEDAEVQTVAVECGFTLWLDENTLVIGVQDRLAADLAGPIGCEWKTAKEPKRNRDGSDSAWWNEEKWLSEIVNGPQLAIYALAMNKAIYYPKGVDRPIRLNAENPRIMVRAAVKSNPPRFWPSESARGVYAFPNPMLVSVENALRVKAEQIRAAKRLGVVPWQLQGRQCFPFNRECQYIEQCRQHAYPVSVHGQVFNRHDPAYELALSRIDPELLKNPELVVLSYSSYSDCSECMERYRILSNGLGPKEESLALEIGGAFHAGIAALYRQYLASNNLTK